MTTSQTRSQSTVDPTPDFTLCGQFLDEVSMPLSALGTELHDETRKALQLAVTAPGKSVVVGTFEPEAGKVAQRFRKGQADVLPVWHNEMHPELPGKFSIHTLERAYRTSVQVERFVYVKYDATA